MTAVLVCHHEDQAGAHGAEWTYWPNRAQARQAEAELTPCGPDCIGVHTVAALDAELATPRGRHLTRFLP